MTGRRRGRATIPGLPPGAPFLPTSKSTTRRNRNRDIEAQALAMLERYDCPMPFHAVRTHFLGAMCAPGPVQPMKTLARLWGGRLPAMPSIDAVNELLGVLISGLWNALTVHQDPDRPYPLMAFPARTTRESLACVAETRAEEIHGFLSGVFGDEESLEVPGSMGESLDALMEVEGIFAGMQELLEDPAQPATASDLKGLRAQVAELTAIAERAMHAVVLDARALREQELARDEKQGAVVH